MSNSNEKIKKKLEEEFERLPSIIERMPNANIAPSLTLTRLKDWAESVKKGYKEEGNEVVRDSIIRGTIFYATSQLLPNHPYFKIGMLISAAATQIPDLQIPNPFINIPTPEGFFAHYIKSRVEESAIEFEAAQNIVNGAKQIASIPMKLYFYINDFLSSKTINLADSLKITKDNIQKIAELVHYYITETPLQFVKDRYQEWVTSKNEVPALSRKSVVFSNDEDEKLKQEIERVNEAKKQAKELASDLSAKKKEEASGTNPNFVLTEEFSNKVQSFAKNLGYCGLAVNEISQAAISLGGHERTWKDIGTRGMGAYKVYAGSVIAGTVCWPLGVLMICNGLLEMVSGYQGDTSHAEIKLALAEIRTILIQGLNQLTQQISEGFNLILFRLKKITLELDRLEPLISSSFKEIHIKDLADIIDEIRKDLTGEFQLSDDDKRKCLRRLSTWIDLHSKAKIQTSLLRDSKDISKCLELLEDSNFDLTSLFPFFILQLSKFLPPELLKNIDLNDLPNLIVLKDACESFFLLINHYQFQDNYAPTLQRALQTFQSMKDIIKQLKEENEIWEILYRQYRDLRYKVGRAIFKYRSENSLNNNLSLGEQLKPSSSGHLMELLDQMEMRRILLQKLAQLTECSSTNYETIQKLDKKSDILKRNGEFYQIKANLLLTWASYEKYWEFRDSIRNGADINSYDNWGQAIHRIIHHRTVNHSAAIKLLHELFKSGKEVAACHRHGTLLDERRSYGTRGGSLMRATFPFTLMVESGYFDLVMLYCANGYDIPDLTNEYSYNYCYNAIRLAGKSYWNFYVQYHLCCEMNNEKSFLNKKDLRKAYEYYKAVEAGIEVSPENISQDCLLWLTCILGDYKPLTSLLKHLSGNWMTKEVMNRTIPNTGFTPLMMAINCNNRKVVSWLVNIKANTNSKVEFEIEKGSSPLMHIAVAQKHFALAEEMRKANCKITAEQSKKIEEGLKEQQPKPFDSSYLTAIVSNNKADEMNQTQVVLAAQQPSQTLLLINKQIENLQTGLQLLEKQPRTESKQDKEASSQTRSTERKQSQDGIQLKKTLAEIKDKNETIESLTKELESVRSELKSMKEQQSKTNLLLENLTLLLRPAVKTQSSETGSTFSGIGLSSTREFKRET